FIPRSRARVVIGNNCSGPSFGIRDYNYHPSYSTEPFSSLVMIQLNIEGVISFARWRPICRPPTHFKDQPFYAMVLSNSCSKSRVRIHKMKYVSPEHCKSFYRRTGADVDGDWPSYTACARSTSGGDCVWRSGAILVVKIKDRWRLLGFGIYGPGCESPARFLDYGKYHQWVAHNIDRMGKPAITTLADNHVVLRRSLAQIQRFGKCDEEEKAYLAYSDYDHITSDKGFFNYNISIYGETNYPCIEFEANHNPTVGTKPRMRLRQWCLMNMRRPPHEVFKDPIKDKVCFSPRYKYGEAHFNVEVDYTEELHFHVNVYRKTYQRFIKPKFMIAVMNMESSFPEIPSPVDTYDKYQTLLGDPKHPWFLRNDEVARRTATTTTTSTTTPTAPTTTPSMETTTVE
ncbi:uncharacterized protein LOC118279082, partial [Spodoptera frugiperda]|uniref:Uncharacterized protein LOC118279082 n=1 Tax=Spodoptera frugiperda TaxID=7108 RepID=A0A9R0ES27_SPOFR